MNLCYETLPFSGGKRLPALAMDAALPSNGNGELIGDDAITQVLDVLRGLLDAETYKRVEGPLLAKSKMSMDQPTAPRAFKPSPANVEAAVDLLRSNGVDDATIGEFYKLYGVEPSQAQDAARRSYASRFPDAARIGGDAKIQLSTDTKKSYAERFPDAARIRCL